MCLDSTGTDSRNSTIWHDDGPCPNSVNTYWEMRSSHRKQNGSQKSLGAHPSSLTELQKIRPTNVESQSPCWGTIIIMDLQDTNSVRKVPPVIDMARFSKPETRNPKTLKPSALNPKAPGLTHSSWHFQRAGQKKIRVLL